MQDCLTLARDGNKDVQITQPQMSEAWSSKFKNNIIIKYDSNRHFATLCETFMFGDGGKNMPIGTD